LIMYNVQPGPLLFTEHPQVAWGLIASMFVGNVMLLILNMPLVRVFAKIISTPPKYLLPIIIAISVFGVYSVQNSIFDLWVLLFSGVLSYFLVKNDFPIAPILLGLVLGPMMENNMRNALVDSSGDWSVFLTRPMSAVLLLASLAWIVVPLILKMRGKQVLVNEEG
jgi:putative tricarboxylic transport membrane protein